MTYTRGNHPNSKANLGKKPRTAGGKKNLTLSPEAIAWLEAQGKGNQAPTVERLIQQAIVDEPVLDQGWLKEHGTIFALSHYHAMYKEAAEKVNKYREAFVQVDDILEASGKDEDLVLADAIGYGNALAIQQIEKEMSRAESLIAQINACEWVESSQRSLDILAAQGIKQHRITRQWFEGASDRAEAGY